MKYKLIYDTKVDKFEEKVNQLLSEGWQLHGDSFFSNAFYCQPMLKADEAVAEQVEQVKPRSKK